MTFIPTRSALLRTAALVCAAFLLCFSPLVAQTTGLYIQFPDDYEAYRCDNFEPGTASLPVLPLGNANVGISYDDQVFVSLPDTCLKILRTWRVIDWNTYNADQPLVVIPNPAGLDGPTVSAPGAPAPWQPSQMGGINYAGL